MGKGSRKGPNHQFYSKQVTPGGSNIQFSLTTKSSLSEDTADKYDGNFLSQKTMSEDQPPSRAPSTTLDEDTTAAPAAHLLSSQQRAALKAATTVPDRGGLLYRRKN